MLKPGTRDVLPFKNRRTEQKGILSPMKKLFVSNNYDVKIIQLYCIIYQ